MARRTCISRTGPSPRYGLRPGKYRSIQLHRQRIRSLEDRLQGGYRPTTLAGPLPPRHRGNPEVALPAYRLEQLMSRTHTRPAHDRYVRRTVAFDGKRNAYFSHRLERIGAELSTVAAGQRSRGRDAGCLATQNSREKQATFHPRVRSRAALNARRRPPMYLERRAMLAVLGIGRTEGFHRRDAAPPHSGANRSPPRADIGRLRTPLQHWACFAKS
jgi:hypothetical protein